MEMEDGGVRCLYSGETIKSNETQNTGPQDWINKEDIHNSYILGTLKMEDGMIDRLAETISNRNLLVVSYGSYYLGTKQAAFQVRIELHDS